MYRIRNPFELLHGTPSGLAILPEYGGEPTLERLAALKKAAALVVLRSRRRALTSQSKHTGGPKHG